MSNPVFIPQLVVGVPLVAPPGTCVLQGSVVFQYVEKTASYLCSDSDKTINCSANSFTITLPTAVGITGREYLIKNTGSGTITVACFGAETIDGDATIVLINDANPTNINGVAVLSTGADWIITSKITN